MSGDIMSTWPIKPADRWVYTISGDGVVDYFWCGLQHVRPVILVDQDMSAFIKASKACVGDEEYQ